MTTPPARQAAVFHVDLVQGQSVIRVFNYNRSTGAFTATAYASGRCAIAEVDGVKSFSIAGVTVMQVNSDGRVSPLVGFDVKPKPGEARLEFIRQTSAVRQVVGAITASGILCSFRFAEEARPNSTDQIFPVNENDLSSVGPNGFVVADGFEAMD